MEEWKDISRYPGYQISSLGRLKKPSGEIQLGSVNTQGYRQFTILGNKVIHAHKEVCLAFHGDKPFPEALALHRNGDKSINTRDNLYWGTHQENMKDRDTHGTTARGDKGGLAKLTWEQVRELRSLRGKVSRTQLCKRFGIARATLQAILNNKTWVES
jgi:hypothetical protein